MTPIDTQLAAPLPGSATRAAALRELGFDGIFTFEGPNDVFLALALAAESGLALMTNIAVAFPHTLMPPLVNPGPNPYGAPKIMMAGVGPLMTRTAAEVAATITARSHGISDRIGFYLPYQATPDCVAEVLDALRVSVPR